MKKLLKNICLVLIAVIFIIGLSGCGDNKVEVEKEDALFKAARKANEATKKAEIQEFNYVLKNYEGDLGPENTRYLFSVIENYSSMVDVEVEGITNASKVKDEKMYNVSYERDEEGNISAIIIKEK